jgi:hypothetical protein
MHLRYVSGIHNWPSERMPSYLYTSPGRREFKQILGHANHLIITAIVGLDAIERGVVTGIPNELHMAWLPKNAATSASRSRRLLLDMALVCAVDALDVHARFAIRKPFLIQSNLIRSEMDRTNRSIFKKILLLESHYPIPDSILHALIVLMITWRNRSVHELDDTDIDEAHKKTISLNAVAIADRFSGLSSQLLLNGYEENRPPVFKEIASFINAAHHYVRERDGIFFESISPEQFLRELLWTSLLKKNKGESAQQSRARVLKSIWGKDISERSNSVDSFLKHCGVSKIETKDPSPRVVFSDDLLMSIYTKTPTTMLKWLEPVSQE